MPLQKKQSLRGRCTSQIPPTGAYRGSDHGHAPEPPIAQQSAKIRRLRGKSAPPVSSQKRSAGQGSAANGYRQELQEDVDERKSRDGFEARKRWSVRQSLAVSESATGRRPGETATSLGMPCSGNPRRQSDSIPQDKSTRNDDLWGSPSLNGIDPPPRYPTPGCAIIKKEDVTAGPYDNFHTPRNSGFYSSFQYHPLERRRHEIRLLSIDSWSQHRYKMIGPVPLANPPPYCAISYVAGDPKDTCRISVDNVVFNAFANLGRAIEDVRSFWSRFHPDQELLLWVDQICINQSDHSERSHQVGYMGQIYRNATHVVIPFRCETDPAALFEDEESRRREFNSWVSRGGPALGNCGYQWQDTERKDRLLTEARKRDIFLDTTGATATRVRARRELTKTIEALAGGWAVICSILAHPWWRRSWTVQELLMASRTTFYVVIAGEGVALRWDLLHEVLRSCIYHSALSSEYIEEVVSRLYDSERWDVGQDWEKRVTLRRSYVTHMKLIRTHWPTAKSTLESKRRRQRCGDDAQLSETLRHARNLESSDPRDKVYAFLGLASSNYNIVADYSPGRSEQDVFTAATERIIKTERHLEVLMDALGNDRRKKKMLSWVPDWASPLATEYSELFMGIGIPRDCKAGGRHPAKFTFRDHEFELSTTRVLEIDAIFVGQLKEVIEDDYSVNWRWSTCLTSHNADIGPVNVATTDRAHSGDEVWIIYGVKWPVSVRKDGEFRCLLGPAILREPARPPQRGRVSPIMKGSLCGYIPHDTLKLL